MSAQTCPKCGQTQPSDASPICECGYDFTVPSTAPSEPPPTSAAARRYHTFWRRFWASLLDSLVLLPLNFGDNTLLASDPPTLVIILWSCLSCASTPLYTILMHARYGQTLGKMVTRVKVLELSERSKPTLRQALLRDIGDVILNALALLLLLYFAAAGHTKSQFALVILPALLLVGLGGVAWYALDVITMLWNSKRRALHDFIAGTVVLRCEARSAPATPEPTTSASLQG